MLPTAHRQAHCLDCGYCLAGLSKRCPECGRRFDPADMSTYAPSPGRWEWYSCGIVGVVVLFVPVIVGAVLA